jgi:hypothetical protein
MVEQSTTKTKKNRRSVKGKSYPEKYLKGLSPNKRTQRKKEIDRYGSLSWKDAAAYVGFKTDLGVKTKPSKYTRNWKSVFPDAKSLEEKAAATGVPLRYIKTCYNRGLAAWRTGHRPGATQQQWGYGRVHSFLLCGKTYYSTDSDLVSSAKKASPRANAWWAKTCR